MEWFAALRQNKKISLAGDTVFALISRLAPRIVSNLLFIILIYRRETGIAGAFSLSIAYLATAVALSSIGLDDLLVREVAMHPARSREYFINAFLLRVVCSVLGYGVLFFFVQWVFHYSPEVDRVILLMGIGILPEGCLALLFSILNGIKKLNWMGYISLFIIAFQLVIGSLALFLGAPLEVLIAILISGSTLGVLASLFLFRRYSSHLQAGMEEGSASWKPSWSSFKALLVKTLPFAFILSVSSVDAQIDVLVLSAFNDLAAVAVYSAARVLAQFLAIIPAAMRMVIYPSLSHAYAHTRDQVVRLYRQSWNYLAVVGVPIVLGGMVLSRKILLLVYHDNVSPAMAWAFAILLLDLMVNFIFQPGARLFLIADRQVLLSILIGFSAAITALLGFFLIPRAGVVGIAIARAAASWLYFLAGEFYILRFILPHNRGALQALKPLLAGAAMAVLVWLLRGLPVFLTIPLGAGIYFLLVYLFSRMKLSKPVSASESNDSSRLPRQPPPG